MPLISACSVIEPQMLLVFWHAQQRNRLSGTYCTKHKISSTGDCIPMALTTWMPENSSTDST